MVVATTNPHAKLGFEFIFVVFYLNLKLKVIFRFLFFIVVNEFWSLIVVNKKIFDSKKFLKNLHFKQINIT